VKYHFLREHLSDEIQVLKVDTTNHIANLFTKGLVAPQFEYLVSKLMGWNTQRQSAPLRGSDAGQDLASNEDQGLLSSLRESGQARPARSITWLESIDDSRLIHSSIDKWNATRLQASL